MISFPLMCIQYNAENCSLVKIYHNHVIVLHSLLQELVASVSEEKQFLESSVGDLQTMILALEDQIKETQDREKMLVLYPDPNPGVGSKRPDGE